MGLEREGSMVEETLLRVGVINADREVLEQCQLALRELAVVQQVSLNPATGASTDLQDIDVLLFSLKRPHVMSVMLFTRCRAANTRKPIIVLGEGVNADLAVELVKNGADDFISYPPDRNGLRHKVQRALGMYQGPGFEWAILRPFKRTHAPPGGKNRRHCYRATCIPHRPITISVTLAEDTFYIDVINISIATDGWPGGLLLSSDASTTRNLPFESWETGAEIVFTMDLPDEAPPINIKGQMVIGLRPGPAGSTRFAVMYWTTRPEDEVRIRRYWADAQRAEGQLSRRQPARP